MTGGWPRPLVIGLTGGIGSGKSHVRETLVSLGAEGIDADREAHAAMAPGTPAFAEVLAEFGRAVLAPDGSIDRSGLAEQVFSDAAALARLEAILHPAVFRAVQARVAASRAPMVVIEAIKLLETGLDRAVCDQVWVTVCSRRQQLARLRASRQMPAAEARRRMASQMSPAAMAARADRVIDTGGSLADTALHVLGAWRELGLTLPQPVVRPGRQGDARGVAAVRKAVAVERVEAGGQTLPRQSRLLVGCLGNVVAGFQVIAPFADDARASDGVAALTGLVAGAARGTGLELALGQAAVASAAAAGYRELVVHVRPDDAAEFEFYASLGFRPAGGDANRLVIQLRPNRDAGLAA